MTRIKAVVLAAGQGARMQSDLPKVMHTVCDKPMVNLLLDTIQKAGIQEITVVVGPDMDCVTQAVKPFKTVVQHQRLGTAHAVLSARADLTPFDGCVLVLFGDSPLIRAETLTQMVDKFTAGTDVVVLGFVPEDPRRYGRLIMGDNGLERIVEYKDADDEQRAVKLCNSGVMCIHGRYVLDLLERVGNNNAAGEYYLTDVVALAHAQGLKCDVVIGDVDELHGVNTPQELETAREIYIKRLQSEAETV